MYRYIRLLSEEIVQDCIAQMALLFHLTDSGSSPTNDRIFFIIISYVPYSFSVVFNNLIYFGQFVYVFYVCLSLSLVGRVISEVDD